jgi:hypothetical protein
MARSVEIDRLARANTCRGELAQRIQTARDRKGCLIETLRFDAIGRQWQAPMK